MGWVKVTETLYRMKVMIYLSVGNKSMLVFRERKFRVRILIRARFTTFGLVPDDYFNLSQLNDATSLIPVNVKDNGIVRNDLIEDTSNLMLPTVIIKTQFNR